MQALDRALARDAAVSDAEEAMRGIRRLTIHHDFTPDQQDLLDELVTFVEDVCTANRIEPPRVTTSLRSEHWPVPGRTTWRFAPPTAGGDLAVVRDHLAVRFPTWQLEGDDY